MPKLMQEKNMMKQIDCAITLLHWIMEHTYRNDFI